MSLQLILFHDGIGISVHLLTHEVLKSLCVVEYIVCSQIAKCPPKLCPLQEVIVNVTTFQNEP